jgi:hypothetical protein
MGLNEIIGFAIHSLREFVSLLVCYTLLEIISLGIQSNIVFICACGYLFCAWSSTPDRSTISGYKIIVNTIYKLYPDIEPPDHKIT